MNDAFRAHEFPALESIESQLALLEAVEQAGQSAVVNQVLTEESTSDAPDLKSVGFKALMTVLAVNESYNADEIITNFQPQEFSPHSAKERFAQLVHQSREVSTSQVMLLLSSRVDIFLKLGFNLPRQLYFRLARCQPSCPGRSRPVLRPL